MGGGGRSLSLTIPLNPVPASRPRLSGRRVYYAKTYATWKRQAKLYLPDSGEPIFTDAVAILTEFIVKRPKTTKRRSPRGDTDNYEKAAWDAVTSCASVWDDDDQILFNLTHKRYAKEDEEPRTEMLIVEL